jgi:hypothetical protein
MSAIPFPSNIGWHRQAARHSPATISTAANDPPTLRRGERVLIRREEVRGRAIAGTDQAVHVQSHGDWRRVPWTDVDVGGWDPATAEAVIKLWPAVDDSPTIRVPVDQRFAAFVAERVSFTQVLRRQIRLSPQGLVTVVALRRPGEESLDWRVHVQHDGTLKQLPEDVEKRILSHFQALIGS